MTTAEAIQIQQAEDEFNAFARSQNPMTWGEEHEAKLAELGRKVTALYEKHNVDQYDRIAGL